MPGECVEACSGLGRPQLDRAIIAAACQVPAIGTEGDSSDGVAAISRMSVTYATASYTLYPVRGHFTATVAWTTVAVK